MLIDARMRQSSVATRMIDDAMMIMMGYASSGCCDVIWAIYINRYHASSLSVSSLLFDSGANRLSYHIHRVNTHGSTCAQIDRRQSCAKIVFHNNVRRVCRTEVDTIVETAKKASTTYSDGEDGDGRHQATGRKDRMRERKGRGR